MTSEQPSAYFVNIMKENYVSKLNLSGVLLFLATHVSFQESICELNSTSSRAYFDYEVHLKVQLESVLSADGNKSVAL